MKYEWEIVSENASITVRRLRIPRTGWLVHSGSNWDSKSFTTCFVPDSTNQWDLKEEKPNK